MELKFLAVGLMAIGMCGAALGVAIIFNSLLNSSKSKPNSSSVAGC